MNKKKKCRAPKKYIINVVCKLECQLCDAWKICIYRILYTTQETLQNWLPTPKITPKKKKPHQNYVVFLSKIILI